MYVFDASPLIVLASAERLSLAASLEGDCVLPEAVYDEVVTAGIDAGHPDPRRIDRAVDDGEFAVIIASDTALHDRLRQADGLSDADAAVLALAEDRDAVAVLDEQYGRSVADSEGIETRGTAYVVLNAQRKGTLDAEQAREAIDDALGAGWYCSPELYAGILDKIEEIG